jgi:DNA-binding response OmpR family regulator
MKSDPSECPSRPPPTILVIDDELFSRRLLHLTLESRGYLVISLAQGEGVDEAFALHHPDLIILDLSFPDTDGVALCQHVRRISPVPIVVMSALDDETVQQQAMAGGADAYLLKPYDLTQLPATISALLQRSAPSCSASSER